MGGVQWIGLGEMVHAEVDVAVASKFRIVAREDNFVFAGRCQDAIVGKRFRGVEIEHENQVTATESKHLVGVFLP